MADHDDEEGADAARLFDTVLAEAVSTADVRAAAQRATSASASERERAWRRAASAEAAAAATLASDGPRVVMPPQWILLAALLGVLVVGATMWGAVPSAVAPTDAPLRWPQDPKPARTVQARDLKHFLELVADSKTLRIHGSEAVGATLGGDATGSWDQLDVVRWPEVVVVTGDDLVAWREAIASSSQRQRGNRLGTLLSARFELADGAEVEAALSAGAEVHLDLGDKAGQLEPNDALRARIQGAHAELERLHRRTSGIALDASELAALPATSEHIECPWFADGSLPQQLRRFASLQSLVLRGDDSGKVALAALDELRTLRALDIGGHGLRDAECALFAAFPELQRLRLRGGNELTGAGLGKAAPGLRHLTLDKCLGLSAAGLRTLAREAPKLQELRLLECDLGADATLIAELPAFAGLRQLTLRGNTIAGEHLAPLLRTKLSVLQLVDVPVRGSDLAPFAALPSLRELAVLALTLDDGSVGDLATLRQLTSLRLMNVKISKDGRQELADALPKCTLDCVPGRRLFDPGVWLLP
jgi:hypothetical protein